MKDIYIKLMEEAFKESQKTEVSVCPNPRVGAVIFNDAGEILSRGSHKIFGGDHAEVDALKKLDMNARGLSMAVTLEPCNREGKTPACSKIIEKSGIKHVIVAARDTNPSFSGGIDYLRKKGVKVTILSDFTEKIREQNRFFFKSVEKNMPWVTLKAAVSVDGRISEKYGKQTLITGKETAEKVHAMRREHMSVAVGAGTVNIDNPKLTVRHVSGRSPRPVVFSGSGRVNPEADLMERNPLVFTSDKNLSLPFAEVECINADDSESFISETLSIMLKKYCINSVLVEGGTGLFSSFLKAGMVDEFHVFVAPVVFGRGPAVFSFNKKDRKTHCDFNLRTLEKSGRDLHFEYRPV